MRKVRAVSGFQSLADIDEAFRIMSAKLVGTTKAMAEIDEVIRRLDRDIARASKRPTLIHNGRKPR
jgi:hypothetical protein